MSSAEREFEFYVSAWNVRLHLSKFIEVVCPKCGGCAVPYYAASKELAWGVEKIQALVSRLPFPTGVEALPDNKGFKLYSFPSEWVSHPDILSHNHSGEDEQTMPMVSLCSECHARSSLGNRVTPKDLYWSVQTRHGVLWAYNREWLVAIKGLIEGDSRPRGPVTNRMPASMLKASNRDEMIKLIDRVLLNGPLL